MQFSLDLFHVADMLCPHLTVFTEQNTTIQLSDARAGDVLSLPCSFTAPGTVTWERVDGQALPTRSVTAIDGSLFLSSLSLSDGGEYLCNVQTNVGDSTLHYNVTVLGKMISGIFL